MAVPLAQFLKRLADSGLMSAEDISSFAESLPPEKRTPAEAQEFARELIRQKLLTSYQATTVYQGMAQRLVLGTYIVLNELGRGGMGQVFKAQHRRMKRIVALKVMSPAGMKSPDAVKRFHREVQAAAKLTHPNIVTAFDADEAAGTHFLVMEHVEGSDLANLVKKNGPLPVAKAVDCIVQAARGLEHAHAQGVVHRDIKPANLLIDKQGTVKILDMGLARIDDSLSGTAGTAAGLTQSGSIMGTVDYMSPEQALNTKYADRRADIYSLGCSLHFLLTGRPVYSGETLMEKLLAHREQPIPSLAAIHPEVSPALDAVFARMIAKRPEERYQTMSEVLHDLQTVSAPAAVAPLLAASHAGEDTAIRDFLAALSPAASATALRTRAEPATAETMASQAAAGTQTSLLKSAARRVSALSGRERLIAAGAVAAIVLVAGLLFSLGSEKKPRPGDSPIVAADPPRKARQRPAAEREKPEMVATANPVGDGEPRLFVSDFDGWNYLPDNWRVENGMLIGSTQRKSAAQNTYVCSPRPFRDFELSFQVRLTGDRANSGVQVRSSLLDPHKLIVAGPQVDLGAGYWGSLYGEKTTGMIKAAPDISDKIHAGDFNDVFVRCSGRHLFVRINGVVTIDDEFPDLSDEGLIAWQLHGGPPMEVAFRNVALRELESPPGEIRAPPVAAGGEWKPLFNGRDLSGWSVQGKGTWTASDGILTTSGPKPGWLMSDNEYGDFELELEYKLPAGGNSGVFLHAWPEGNVEGSQFLEIQLLDEAAPRHQNIPPQSRTGAIFGTAAPSPAPKTPAGQWHRLLVRIENRRVQEFFNGQQVLDVNLDDFKEKFARFPGLERIRGRIGLQDYSPGLQFRGIRVRPLN